MSNQDDNQKGIQQQYREAMHAMQSGVAAKMQRDGGSGQGATSPKHLRVGINSAMVSHAALVKVLVSAGLIDGDEYARVLLAEMQDEARRYEDDLGVHLL